MYLHREQEGGKRTIGLIAKKKKSLSFVAQTLGGKKKKKRYREAVFSRPRQNLKALAWERFTHYIIGARAARKPGAGTKLTEWADMGLFGTGKAGLGNFQGKWGLCRGSAGIRASRNFGVGEWKLKELIIEREKPTAGGRVSPTTTHSWNNGGTSRGKKIRKFDHDTESLAGVGDRAWHASGESRKRATE